MPEFVEGALEFLNAELKLCSQLVALYQHVSDIAPYRCVGE